MARILAFLVVVFSLASCQILGGNSGEANNTGGDSNTAVIFWDRSPAATVFRAEITGGEDADAFYMRNEVPLCAIYGDGRVIWRVDDSSGTQILFDTLDDATIRTFVETLTIQETIYRYDAEADLQVPTSMEPVVEQITLAVNDSVHVTDSYSDWDYQYFVDIVEMCQGLSRTPTIYEPEAAWVSAVEIPFSTTAPSILWDASAAGLDLAALAESGERQWISGRNVRVLWNLIRRSAPDLQFNQGIANYQVALEVPNVTHASPPPP